MTFRALNDRIYVAPEKAPEKIGSLFIPPSAGAKLRREHGLVGVVRYMGPGLVDARTGENIPMPDVKVGDRVIYLDQPWTETEVAGEKLLSIRTGGIIAVVESDGESAT